jgi:hypothetical protein
MSHGFGTDSFSMLYILQILKLIHFDAAVAPGRKLMRLRLCNTIFFLLLNKGTRKQFSKAVFVEPEPLGCGLFHYWSQSRI